MPSRVRIGPNDGPYVEIDEENGELVIRVPEDTVDFDTSDIENILVVGNTGTSEPDTPTTDEMARWYDATNGAYKAKFDDGETVTIAQK